MNEGAVMSARRKFGIEKKREKSSHELRAAANAKRKALDEKLAALSLAEKQIIAANPEIQRLRAEARTLHKERDEVQWQGRHYQFQAYRDGSLFRTIIAEGDTQAECSAKAKAKYADAVTL